MVPFLHYTVSPLTPCFPGGLVVKNLLVQETQVSQFWSLGWKDPLEWEMATHSSILAWKILQAEKPGGLLSWVRKIPWSRKWQLLWFQVVLASSSPVFHMMYSAHKVNKQGDNIQLWRTPFPIWNQSVVLCPVPTVGPWPAYRFLRRQVRWSVDEFSTVCCDPHSQKIWHSQ